MSRSYHRRLSVALVSCAALATAGLLAGCGAGQIAATANVVPAVPGANADVSVKTGQVALDGTISVRDATVDYHGVQGYAAGAPAPLTMRIVNGTPSPVTLVDVTATLDGQAVPVVQSGGTPTGLPSVASPTPAATSASPSPSAARSASAKPGTSGSPAVSATPSESPSPSPSPLGSSEINIPVPAAPAGLVVLGEQPSDGTYLQLSALPAALINGATVRLVLTFKLSDGSTVTLGAGDDPRQQVNAPVTVPTDPAPRSSLSFGPDNQG